MIRAAGPGQRPRQITEAGVFWQLPFVGTYSYPKSGSGLDYQPIRGCAMTERERSTDPNHLCHAELDEWTVVVDISPFVPTCTEVQLIGRIYGDKLGRFPDGRWVLTSAVKTPFKRIKSGAIVQTANTRYRLLSPAKHFAGARPEPP